MPRDLSNMPLPPAVDPPRSDFDTVFGQDAGWRDPAGPARAAARAEREAAAAAAAATAAAPAAPQAPTAEFSFDYPDNGVLYRPAPLQAGAPPGAASAPAAPVQPTQESETPKFVELVTESGFQIQADPKEVAKRWAEHERLKKAAEQAEALRQWIEQNPKRAVILEKVVRGDSLDEILADSSKRGDDEEDAENPAVSRALAQAEARARALEMELESTRRGQMETTQAAMIQQALDAVPFAKSAAPGVRDAIRDLALIDYARHQHEGINLQDAVRRRAAQLEASLRENLEKAATPPRTPSPLGPDRSPPSQVTTRRPGTNGLGLAEFLQNYRMRP